MHPIWEFQEAPLTPGGSGIVESAGDVDGDGYADVLVRDGERALHVFLGGPSGPSAVAQVVITGAGSFAERFGSAGDLDDDGDDEVWSLRCQQGFEVVCVVDLFEGSPTGLQATPALTLFSPDGGEFGFGVGAPGDLDHDGIDDLLVGAQQGWEGAGRVWLYKGSSGGITTTPDATFTGEIAFGNQILPLGDTDGDGELDLAIEQLRNEHGNGAYLTYEGVGLGSTGLRFEVDDLFPVGDLDADGFDDVMWVHAWQADPVQFGLWRGSATGLTDAWTVDYPDLLVASARSVGDLDGDGIPEIGVDSWDRVHLFDGATLDLTNAPTATVAAMSFSAAGDLDRDGIGDLVMATDVDDDWVATAQLGPVGGFTSIELLRRDHVRGLHIGADLASADLDGDGDREILAMGTRTLSVFSGPTLEQTLVHTDADVLQIADVGDLDGDGDPEVVIANYVDVATLLDDDPMAPLPLPFVIEGGVAGGDIDGDGYSDLVAGTYAGDHPGIAVYRGSAAGLVVGAPIAMQIDIDSNFAPTPIVADFDADGYADIALVGHSWGYDSHSDRYQLGVMPGSASGPTGSFTLMIDEGVDLLVGAATDTNGDGASDLVLSGYQRRVMMGGSGGLSAPIVLGDGFWETVAPAGDVDGDGYGDVVFSYSGEMVMYGSAGGPDPLRTEPLDSFNGGRARGVGDIDGDGLGDVVCSDVRAQVGHIVIWGQGDVIWLDTGLRDTGAEPTETGGFWPHDTSVDDTDALSDTDLPADSDTSTDDAGCGCGSGSAAGLPMLLALAFGIRRRQSAGDANER